MFRDDNCDFKPKTKTINLLLLDGGLGDHIGSLVAVDYLIKRYPWIKPLVWMPDYLTSLAHLLLPSGTYIKGFSYMKGRYEPSKPTKSTKWDGYTSPMKIHLVDYAFLKLCDENPSIEFKNYLKFPEGMDLTTFNLPEKYVVLTTGFTAEVREWPVKEINLVAKWLVANGITPVFIGQKDTKTGIAQAIQGNFRQELAVSLGIDLIDQTSLVEAAAIMDNSLAVLGVDNGLLHVAGCTKAPIIAGYTTVSPSIRLPIRFNEIGYNCISVTPDRCLKCSFCQEKTNFLYGHDYKKCIYSDNLCTTHMTADKFISALKEIL